MNYFLNTNLQQNLYEVGVIPFCSIICKGKSGIVSHSLRELTFPR